MEMQMSRKTALIISFMSAPAAAIADAPWRGTLIGQTSGDILQYSCTELDDRTADCDFTQVLLSPKATEEEWPERLQELRTAFGEVEESLGDFCDTMIDPMGRYIADGMPTDTSSYNTEHLDLSVFAEQVRNETGFIEKWVGAGQQYCRTREFEDLSVFFRLGHEQEMNTCEPFINNYSQRYTRSTENHWVVAEPPQGSCGVINTSSFVREDGDGTLWRHLASKIITNPEGPTSLGIHCSDLDDSITNYEWNSFRIPLNCEFID